MRANGSNRDVGNFRAWEDTERVCRPSFHDLHSTSRDESTQTKDKHMSKLTSVGEDETVLPDCDPNLERPQ
jgi:hypothetical protein